MALSKKARVVLASALTDAKVAKEIADAIDGPTTVIQQVEDQSVNLGSIRINSAGVLAIRTQQGTNPAGNFNGGGTGSKAIGGWTGYNNLPFKNFPKIEYTFKSVDLLYANSGAYCYMNAQVDLNGDGSDIRIMQFCFKNATPNLQACARTVNADGSVIISFDKTLHGVVMIGNPISGVVPIVGTDLDSFSARRYLIADIAAVYPNSKIIDNVSLDGGMPKYVKVKALVFILADSGTNAQLYAEVYNAKINSIPVMFKL